MACSFFGQMIILLLVLVGLPLYGALHRYVPILAHQKGYRIAEIQGPIAPGSLGDPSSEPDGS